MVDVYDQYQTCVCFFLVCFSYSYFVTPLPPNSVVVPPHSIGFRPPLFHEEAHDCSRQPGHPGLPVQALDPKYFPQRTPPPNSLHFLPWLPSPIWTACMCVRSCACPSYFTCMPWWVTPHPPPNKIYKYIQFVRNKMNVIYYLFVCKNYI